MPSTPMKNAIYRLALPFCAPNPHKQMKHSTSGIPVQHLPYYEHILVKNRVLGASLLLCDGQQTAQVFTSVMNPRHVCSEDTLFRVASITKMATALVTLMCIHDRLFSLDTPICSLLPETKYSSRLTGMTVRHLLCHTSGLRDHPIVDRCLSSNESFESILAQEDVIGSAPGAQMEYCNFGFGLLGCLLEQVTGRCISQLFKERLFDPLGIVATLDASALDETRIMPISRILPYHAGKDVTVTTLGRKPLTEPDPLRHYGHTAGAMYTNAASISKLLDLIGNKGIFNGIRYMDASLIDEMTSVQSSTPTRTYGLGLVLLNRKEISSNRLLGHQGFAYGCVDGAFIEEGTGRKVVFLNGGASEARLGKLGVVNRDILRWAYQKEFPAWT